MTPCNNPQKDRAITQARHLLDQSIEDFKETCRCSRTLVIHREAGKRSVTKDTAKLLSEEYGFSQKCLQDNLFENLLMENGEIATSETIQAWLTEGANMSEAEKMAMRASNMVKHVILEVGKKSLKRYTNLLDELSEVIERYRKGVGNMPVESYSDRCEYGQIEKKFPQAYKLLVSSERHARTGLSDTDIVGLTMAYRDTLAPLMAPRSLGSSTKSRAISESIIVELWLNFNSQTKRIIIASQIEADQNLIDDQVRELYLSTIGPDLRDTKNEKRITLIPYYDPRYNESLSQMYEGYLFKPTHVCETTARKAKSEYKPKKKDTPSSTDADTPTELKTNPGTACIVFPTYPDGEDLKKFSAYLALIKA